MFTSRLPISTSARRPTGHTNDGSTSFVGGNRPSNMPVTVRKANLFTPQTKRPFQIGGASTAGKSFMSGTTTEKKFSQRASKPMPDRDQQVKMYDTLVDYVKANARDQVLIPEPKRFFSSISTTETSRIFEFLIGRIISDFKITRLETDVPEILNLLDYPYIRSVTKSSLVSVTTRQAVVSLLVIFDWLIKFINQAESARSDAYEDDSDRGEILKNICLGYSDEQLIAINDNYFEQKYPLDGLEFEQNELDGLIREIRTLSEELDETDELKQVSQALDDDIAKLIEYEVQMKEYRETKYAEGEELKHHLSKLENQNDEARQTIKRISAEIQSHELDMGSVEREQATIDTLEKKLGELLANKGRLNAEKEHLEKTCQNLKFNFNDLMVALEESFKPYQTISHLGSNQLDERILGIQEWIIKLSQAPPSERIIDDLKLFLEKLHATEPSMISEVTNTQSDKKLETEKIEAGIKKSEVPRLREAIERIKAETENEKRQFESNLAKIRSRLDGDSKQILVDREKHSEVMTLLAKERTIEMARFKADDEECHQIDNLNSEHLNALMIRSELTAKSALEDTQNDTKRWLEVREVTEHNEKVVRNAFKLFKRRV